MPLFSMDSLLKESCAPLAKDAVALDSSTTNELISLLDSWELGSDNNSIARNFKFNNYYETISFVNSVAWIAHQQDHHPELFITYNQCKVSYSTHSVGGLSRNDFICAARINQLFR
jgi:4a-hydroxytetrahydrobiopterin dehydratase